MDDQLSRRAVLTLLGGGAAAIAGAAYVTFTDDPSTSGTGDRPVPELPEQVAGVSAGDPLAFVGARYLVSVPDEASPLELASLVGLQAPPEDRAAIEAELSQARTRISNDFANGEVVDVDGWQLSSTEARLCALIALAA